MEVVQVGCGGVWNSFVVCQDFGGREWSCWTGTESPFLHLC